MVAITTSQRNTRENLQRPISQANICVNISLKLMYQCHSPLHTRFPDLKPQIQWPSKHFPGFLQQKQQILGIHSKYFFIFMWWLIDILIRIPKTQISLQVTASKIHSLKFPLKEKGIIISVLQTATCFHVNALGKKAAQWVWMLPWNYCFQDKLKIYGM